VETDYFSRLKTPICLTGNMDKKHSTYEDRYITIGQINNTTVIVVVVYTERTNTIRIISARAATKREREAYYNA
jgi:uncharacterized DUF497 family protein